MYLERFEFNGRIGLVTGAAQGIGRATAEAPSGAGAYAVPADMNGKKAQ
jgi:NAD(P)-dependent dehydrogenase (short-subunit alcohol dehydrogenase family)